MQAALPHFSLQLMSRAVLILVLVGFSFPLPLRPSPLIVRASGATFSVSIVDNAFQPPHVNVTTGTEVIWTYSRTGTTFHTVTSSPQTNVTQAGSPLIDSGDLHPGQSFNYTFYKHGFYPIQCYVHPQTMNGWVNVTGSDIQPPLPPATPSTNYTPYIIGGAIAGAIAIGSVILVLRHRTQKVGSTSVIKV